MEAGAGVHHLEAEGAEVVQGTSRACRPVQAVEVEEVEEEGVREVVVVTAGWEDKEMERGRPRRVFRARRRLWLLCLLRGVTDMDTDTDAGLEASMDIDMCTSISRAGILMRWSVAVRRVKRQIQRR